MPLRLFSSQSSSPSIAVVVVVVVVVPPHPTHPTHISKTPISNNAAANNGPEDLPRGRARKRGRKQPGAKAPPRSFAEAAAGRRPRKERSPENDAGGAPRSVRRRNKYWNIGRKSVVDDAPPPPIIDDDFRRPGRRRGGSKIHGAPGIRAAVTGGEDRARARRGVAPALFRAVSSRRRRWH